MNATINISHLANTSLPIDQQVKWNPFYEVDDVTPMWMSLLSHEISYTTLT